MLPRPREALRFAASNSFSMSGTFVYHGPKDKSYPNIKAVTGIKELRCQPCAGNTRAVAPSHQMQSVTFCYKMLKFDKFK